MLEKLENVLKSTFARVIGKGIVLAFFPIILFVCLCVTRAFLPGFWTEFATIVAGTITVFVIIEYIKKGDVNKEFVELLSIVFLACSCGLLGDLVHQYNQNQNNLAPLILVLAIAIILFFLVVILLKFPNRRRSYYFEKVCIILSKIVATITITGLLVEMYLNFGTQFVWVIALGLSAFTLFFIVTRKFFEDYTNEDLLIGMLSVSPIVIALIGTIYQFWFSELFLGVVLWQVLLALTILAVLVYGSYLSDKSIKGRAKAKRDAEAQAKRVQAQAELKAKQDAEKKAADEKVKAEEEERKKQRGEEADAKKKLVVEKQGELDWGDILCVSRHYTTSSLYEVSPNFTSKIHLAPLKKLLSVSVVKGKMVFNKDLSDALSLINDLAGISYRDGELQDLIKQVEEFILYVEQYAGFKGYQSTMNEIKSYTTIYELIPVKEKV